MDEGAPLLRAYTLKRCIEGSNPSLSASSLGLPDGRPSQGMPMDTQRKRKIAFALSMGVVTTGIISFAIIALNLGFSGRFAQVWLRSWVIGYVMVVPAILLIGPWLQARIDRLIQ